MAPPFLRVNGPEKGIWMSRKKETCLLAINTLTAIHAGPYTDHLRLAYRLGRDYKNVDFFQYVARRMAIDRFRNQAFRFALDSNLDYILFIDDDMHIPADTFGMLRAAKLDICMAHVYVRGYPFEIMAYKLVKTGKGKSMRPLSQEDILPENCRADGVKLCDAIGTSTCLIRMKNLRKLPAPWFVTGAHNTEDIYFCCKAKDFYKKTTVGIHTKVITGHQLDPEVICKGTRDALMTYAESFMPPEEKLQWELRNGSGDRGQSYVDTEIDPIIVEPTA